MSSHQETETAFGRPASWLAALPAVVVGCGAFLLAVYGTWFMPAQLRPQYLAALEKTRAEYNDLTTGPALSVNWKIGEVAGDMDVIYSRLVGLEGVDADRYWEWAQFLRSHATAVERMIGNPAASVQPDTRERLLEQAQQFETKANDIVAQLAAGKSHLRDTAFLSLAQTRYETGIGELGVQQPQQLIAELRNLLPDVGEDVEGGADKLDAAQLESAQLLLIQLMIEAAWQTDETPGVQSRLSCDEKLLLQAWEQYRLYRPASLSGDRGVQWQALGELLAAMTGETRAKDESSPPDPLPNTAAVDVLDEDRSQASEGWQRELAELQLAAVEADWTQLSFLLSRHEDTRRAAVPTHLSRTICRLACSPLAQVPEGWADRCEVGILLVVQAAPHLPETSELLWECSRHQSGSEPSSIALSPLVPEAIVRGQSAALKHSVSALSATQAGEATVARTHLQLILRAHAGLGLVARTALWRAQVFAPPLAASATADSPHAEAAKGGSLDAEVANGSTLHAEATQELNRLIDLMKAVSELEPESGLNWFALGTLQFRAQQLEPMQQSLERARALLGNVPAIDQMLKAKD